jgi:hypothetical protein
MPPFIAFCPGSGSGGGGSSSSSSYVVFTPELQSLFAILLTGSSGRVSRMYAHHCVTSFQVHPSTNSREGHP